MARIPLSLPTELDARCHYLAQLGLALADDGIAAHRDEIDQLARFAVTRGVAPVAARVLADPAAPQVMRLRAFASVTRELDAVELDLTSLVTRDVPAASERDARVPAA